MTQRSLSKHLLFRIEPEAPGHFSVLVEHATTRVLGDGRIETLAEVEVDVHQVGSVQQALIEQFQAFAIALKDEKQEELFGKEETA